MRHGLGFDINHPATGAYMYIGVKRTVPSLPLFDRIFGIFCTFIMIYVKPAEQILEDIAILLHGGLVSSRQVTSKCQHCGTETVGTVTFFLSGTGTVMK